MKIRKIRPSAMWVVCGVALLGCSNIITLDGPGAQDSESETRDNRGFQDSGSVFVAPPEDEHMDLLPPLVPESDGETATESFFLARAIDPASEDSAGPKFVVTGDIDNDGLPDLATAWNQSQVVQVHFQRQDADGKVTFESVQIGGGAPVAIVAGLEVADMDADGELDLVVLIKHNASMPFCPLNGNELPAGFVGEINIFFAPLGELKFSGANWEQVRLTTSIFGANGISDAGLIQEALQACNEAAQADCIAGALPACGGDVTCAGELCADASCSDEDVEGLSFLIDDNFPGLPAEGGRAADLPELGGMNALDVGDVNGDGRPDILATSNVPSPPCHNGLNDIEVYPNPGGAVARDGDAWPQVIIARNGPVVKDVVLHDVDDDGDLDVVFTRPSAASINVGWLTNPGGAASLSGTLWEVNPIGQVDKGSDVITIGDIDGDGFEDVVLRSNFGKLIQWFRHPSPTDDLNVDDVTSGIPWSVYTLVELIGREPLGLTLGDINFDGQLEVLLGAEGSVFFVDSSTAATVFDEWSTNLVVDDRQLENSLFAGEGPAFINELLVVDLDCDGANDIVATIDRRSLSGLSTDVVVWFRNILLPEDVGIDEPLVPGCAKIPLP